MAGKQGTFGFDWESEKAAESTTIALLTAFLKAADGKITAIIDEMKHGRRKDDKSQYTI